ncbi:RNA polymerase sigma factor [Numidum massiliense]|uniref:RNA polymerase sigma factor n=1 Tax=Numidum massiliense TaxID=1522315 RepID=UPI0006D5837A|nr:RNA polymerase sigma factor [Numidum massiliense]
MADFSELEAWFTAYGSDVHNYLRYYSGKNDVEDLVQDVFLKALKGLPSFEKRSSPKTWLFAIARRVAVDDGRKQFVAERLLQRATAADTAAPLPTPTPEDVLSAQEGQAELYAAIRTLKRPHREVLLLRALEEFTPQETADILGWSKTRVNVTLHRALKALRQAYDHMEGGVNSHVARKHG